MPSLDPKSSDLESNPPRPFGRRLEDDRDLIIFVLQEIRPAVIRAIIHISSQLLFLPKLLALTADRSMSSLQSASKALVLGSLEVSFHLPFAKAQEEQGLMFPSV